MVRLSSMVVNDIEDDFNSVGVQSGNQFSEFFNRRLRLRGIAKVWTEEIEGHVSPVIVFLWIKLVNWHQLDNGHPEINEVWDLLDNSGESSSTFGGDPTTGTSGKTPDMHFVNDRVRIMTGRRNRRQLVPGCPRR